MDLKTEQILKIFNSHLKIKNFVTVLCYSVIVVGIFVYVFYAFNQSNAIKLVNEYKKKNPQEYKTEKIMTNPRIDFQYNDGHVYKINAKKALNKNDEEVTLLDVFATGDIGNITAGELQIEDNGDHLVFTKNPVLILNKTNSK